ncbi:MAG TPA: YkgJ family cysteine cluster protein [Desulfobulbus sp.]|nr:YkgJ family cysteine cluster protein [Desulfobulbus sp.]
MSSGGESGQAPREAAAGSETAGGTCRRCGTCCRQGGPALHSGDLGLIRSGALRREHLVTVRRGELALAPLAREPEPVGSEFLKVRGQGGEWCCLFYDHASRGCTIYRRRPVACGLLDCSRPEEILAIAGRDLLTRFDCMAPDDPLLALVREHERQCPCPDLARVGERLQSGRQRRETLHWLTGLVSRDLAIRSRAAARHGLSVELELFCFGRPLFQVLVPLGVVTRESATGLTLQYGPQGP